MTRAGFKRAALALGWRLAGVWLALGIMAHEGRAYGTPGIGFVLALVLLWLAIVPRKR